MADNPLNAAMMKAGGDFTVNDECAVSQQIAGLFPLGAPLIRKI